MSSDRAIKERISENRYYENIDVEKIDINDQPYMFRDMMGRIINSIGTFNGKKILDLGAGTGILSIIMAKNGADVTAVDVSDKACSIMERLSRRYGVTDNMRVVNGTLDDIRGIEKQDHVICLNSLHHMLLSESIDSIRGILKDGGKVIMIEPIAYNPLAWGFRKLCRSEGRTEYEAPFRKRDICNIAGKFKDVSVKGVYLLSTILLLFERLFKTGEKSRFARSIFNVVNKVDDVVLKVPGMKYLAWKVMIVGSK